MRRLSILFWLGLCAALVVPALVPERGLAFHMVQATIWFLGGLAVFSWVAFDRRLAGQRFTTPAKYGVILLGPVYLLPYVLRTRGLGRGSLLTLVFLLKLAGVLLLAIVIIAVLAVFGLVELPA
jgi:hypothetical protein